MRVSIFWAYLLFLRCVCLESGVISVDLGNRDIHFSYDSGVKLRKRLGFSEYGTLNPHKDLVGILRNWYLWGLIL
jgi:hypothetical protein